MASTSLVSDTIIDASATPQEVTVSIVMATLLVVLILLHVIFYIVANRKLEEWFRRFRQLLPKSRSSTTPRVTIMNVKRTHQKRHAGKNRLRLNSLPSENCWCFMGPSISPLRFPQKVRTELLYSTKFQ